jgi:hypothetical protein
MRRRWGVVGWRIMKPWLAVWVFKTGLEKIGKISEAESGKRVCT